MGRKRKGMKGFYRGIDKEGRVAWLKSPHAEEESNKMHKNMRDQILSMHDEVRATADQAIIELSYGNEEEAEELMRKGAEIFKDSERLSDLYETFPKRRKKKYDWTQRYAKFQEFYKMKQQGDINDTDGSDPRKVQAKIEGYGEPYTETDLNTIRAYVLERANQRERENRYDEWKRGSRDVPDDSARYTPLQRDHLSRVEMQRIDRLANGEDSIEDYISQGKFPTLDMSQANAIERSFIRTTDKLNQDDRDKQYDQINKFSASIYARAMTKGYKGINNENGSIRDLDKMIKEDYQEYQEWQSNNPDQSMNDYFNSQKQDYDDNENSNPIENDNTHENVNSSESTPDDNYSDEDFHDDEEVSTSETRRQRSSVPTMRKRLLFKIISMLPNVLNIGRARVTSRGGVLTGVGINTRLFNFLIYDNQHKAANYDGVAGSSKRYQKYRNV